MRQTQSQLITTNALSSPDESKNINLADTDILVMVIYLCELIILNLNSYMIVL
jgi:hypothetical protein